MTGLLFSVVDTLTGRVMDADGITATVDGSYRWRMGLTERVTVRRVRGGSAFVSWPDSCRVLDGRQVRRPDGWVDLDRVEMPRAYSVVSPNGVPHLMVSGHCGTCGLGHDWLSL